MPSAEWSGSYTVRVARTEGGVAVELRFADDLIADFSGPTTFDAVDAASEALVAHLQESLQQR